MSGYNLCIPRNETAWPRYFQNRIIMFCLPISTLMYLWAIYILPGSVCLFCCSQIGSWKYIKRSQTHKCRNCERGRAASFLGTHKWGFLIQYNVNSGRIWVSYCEYLLILVQYSDPWCSSKLITNIFQVCYDRQARAVDPNGDWADIDDGLGMLQYSERIARLSFKTSPETGIVSNIIHVF